VDARLFTAPDLFTMLRQSIGDNTVDEKLEWLKRVGLLIIDDWGKEYGSEWEQARLGEILLARYRNLAPTMLTTNHPVKELPDWLYSRFSDAEMGRVVENRAPDFRSLKRKR
jgi:primosomal protein DnaI